ncbi:hypothetical protein PGT21_050220 [Puccinia graminis f. sp. tritici]|uniref:Uncharacterized protein n=1 Tax=Puccinia graminis f. sp. tritici TaxID=56615 RepID=A0A5B0P052_PUCGR|nr:hypothetical protein PGTUg99_003035 [Puccinia graminis f. sp. tritici]KAA1094905.1 hypothetical protein PGT21_050220 [Puccinia graminis f. sp. tritici]
MSPATNSNQATPSNAVADNSSVKRLLVPADGSARAEEPAATTLGGNAIAKPTEKGTANRKTRAVKGKPSQTVANTGKKNTPTLPHVVTGGGYVRDTLGEEAFLGLGDDKGDSSQSDDEPPPLSQISIKRNHNKILYKNIEVATLRGDTESVEMLQGMLHNEPIEPIERAVKTLPSFKRILPRIDAGIYATNANGSSVAPLAIPLPSKRDQEAPSAPITQGGLHFMSGAVTTHADIGFTPFFDKNIKELRAPLPLTIFNKDWQERAITYHVVELFKLKKRA